MGPKDSVFEVPSAEMPVVSVLELLRSIEVAVADSSVVGNKVLSIEAPEAGVWIEELDSGIWTEEAGSTEENPKDVGSATEDSADEVTSEEDSIKDVGVT